MHQEKPSNEVTEWTVIEEPEEIQKQLIGHMKLHFRQAHGTPFTVSPLKDDVDYTATTQACKDILNGMYEHGSISDSTALFISL